MANAWIEHVRNYQASHPGMSYKVAMTEARATYVKGGKTGQTGQTGGVIGALAGLAVSADALSVPISKSVLRNEKNLKQKDPVRYENTKLIGEHGLVGAIPDLIKNSIERGKKKRAQRG